MDQMGGQMSSLLSKGNMDQWMMNGLMNFLSWMSMTGLMNLVVRLLKELWVKLLLITGLMLMMSECFWKVISTLFFFILHRAIGWCSRLPGVVDLFLHVLYSNWEYSRLPGFIFKISWYLIHKIQLTSLVSVNPNLVRSTILLVLLHRHLIKEFSNAHVPWHLVIFDFCWFSILFYVATCQCPSPPPVLPLMVNFDLDTYSFLIAAVIFGQVREWANCIEAAIRNVKGYLWVFWFKPVCWPS